MNARSITLALVSGGLQILSFPLAGGVSLGFLAWVCLVPLLVAIEGKTLKQAFYLGGTAGIAANIGLLYWLIYCMGMYSDMSIAVIMPVFLLLVIIMAAIQGLFAVIVNWTSMRLPAFSLILVPCIWVATELIRTYFPLGGFPWNLLGLSQHGLPPIIQIAEVTGVYGVSFAVALVNAALARTIIAQSRKEPAWRELVLSMAVVVLLAAYGYVRIYQVDRAFRDQPALKVGIIQGNIDQADKWDAAKFWHYHYKYIGLSEKLLQEKTDLLIWPEAAIATYLNREWERRHTPLVNTISVFDAYFLVGSVTGIREKDRQHVYNSAYLMSPFAERLLGRYDKIHLVPFGEYVPYKRLLFFADAIAAGATGDTDPGQELVVFNTPGFSFACVICFEVIFPDLVRRFVKEGARFMTTITNDTWFGRSSAPYQHHANVIFRCVENRVYFARSAQTGISSIVDPAGRVLMKTKIFEEATLRGEVRPSPYRTVYTRFGDWFLYLASLCAAAGVAACAVKSRREKS